MNWKKLAFIPLSLTLSSCFGYMVPGENFRGPSVKSEQVKQYYFYKKQNIVHTTEILETTANYTIKRLEFKSSMHTKPDNDTVKVDYYDVNGEQKTPLIIISPILGGNNKVSKIFAEYFANHGLANAIVHRPKDKMPYNNDYAGGLENILKQSIMDTRRAIDILEQFPDIDKNKIGSFGVSLGAIKNATLAGIEDRLKVNIFVMGGADIPDILAHSKEGGIIDALNDVFHEKGGDVVFDALRKLIISDPKNLAQYIDDENSLMYISLFDEVVPVKNQKLLRDLIGHPNVIYLWAGHYSAATFLLPPVHSIQRTSYNFFKERFNALD